MAIVRWDPFRDFGFTAPSTTWLPPVDIYQTGDHELVLKAELPDMTRERHRHQHRELRADHHGRKEGGE